MQRPLTFLEFFAGGGMARAGLGQGWRCTFANDFDPGKAKVYRAAWGGEDLVEGDVWGLQPEQIPGRADLAWASSPCQDLSLAGNRRGLGGERSSAFWGFWRLVEALGRQGRAPRAVVVENVAGLLTSHGGDDLAAVCGAFDAQGYRFGLLEVDAARFLPQSRPRVFIVGLSGSAPAAPAPSLPFHSRRVVEAVRGLPTSLAARAAWWSLPEPLLRNSDLASVMESDAVTLWHPPRQTERLLSMLSPLQQQRLDAERSKGERRVAALFRRTRLEDGRRVQRAELRFDGLAGCLRTPGGGSSRQFLVVCQGGAVRTRPLTAREGARLMGLPDSYPLPSGSTAALHVVGDGVAVPAVRWIAAHLLEPALAGEGLLAAE